MAFSSLTKSEVRALSADLRASGFKLPKSGWCVSLGDGREVCRDARGYYIVGMKRVSEKRGRGRS